MKKPSLLLIALLTFASVPVMGDAGFPMSADDKLVQQGRLLIAQEHPEVIRHMMRNDGFGGLNSATLATSMLSSAPDHVAAARAAMKIEQHGRGIWLIRFPYVNVGLVETKRGLVLFDTGYAAIGPVLTEIIPTLSPKPLTHIVVSHIHVDHAYGWSALKTKWPKAKTITSDIFMTMAAKEVRLGGSIGRFNNQALSLQPRSVDRLPKPDITFKDSLSLEIGGERFDFHHDPAETEDQIWMSVRSRKAIFTADYYQGFLPNAGNGKRILRHIDEWAEALRKMASLHPAHIIPMHNVAIDNATDADRVLSLNADALEYISDQVVAKLNAGERKDVIATTIDWPERFATASELDPQYNRPEDIARMVALRWTGWWDDIPSHFAAMRFDDEAREALRLAGGLEAVEHRALELLKTDPKLAARLADWAYYGAPDDPRALQLTIKVYLARIAEPGMPLQESQVYFSHAARARAKLEAAKLTH